MLCKECLQFARESQIEHGLIRDPGKFEGEPLRTYHAWHYVMEGFIDDTVFDLDETPIDLVGRSIISSSGSGFVYGEHYDSEAEAVTNFQRIVDVINADREADA